MSAAAGARVCSLCNFSSPSQDLWLSHLRSVHSQDDDFSVTCDINGCGASYSKCSSYVSHVYRRHRESFVTCRKDFDADKSGGSDNFGDGGESGDYGGQQVSMYRHTPCEGYENSRTDLQHAIDQILQTDSDEQQKKGALYILNLKEICGLSESAINCVIKETQKVFSHTIGRVKAGVNECISRSSMSLDESLAVDLNQFFTTVRDPFEGVHSTFLQESFYRNRFGCMDAVEVKVGRARYTTKFSGSKRRKVLRTDTFQYIPIEETLTNLLQKPTILKEIENFHGSMDKTLRDMCDGSIFHSHPHFSSDNRTIQVIAYFDEVELCNPLGSSTKKHKLGCIFFTIGNIRQQFRSWLKCIFVVSVASTPVIRKHGMNLFLQPFVDSMKMLENDGLTVSIEGKTRHFKVGLLAMLADNLAAHALGGFKESMSFARRICRSCMATTEQIQGSFLESEFELRTPLSHRSQLQELNGPSHAEKSTEYGINRESNLEDIPRFSVAQNIPHDIMHDLLEGVVPYEMKLMLKQLIAAKLVTIATLNDRLRSFDFGYSELSDKPSEIDEKVIKHPNQKIRQSASKMWLLAVYLPLLIGDLIPEDCKVWKLFILLLRICSIAAAWQIEPGTISYLEVLIQEHHSQFRQLYPDKTIIPKMHYMVHYPTQILLYGPLIYSWTMRYEAKLSVIKRASSHGNFKNICYTVAKRTLHALCYQLNCEQPFLARRVEVSNVSPEIQLPSESEELRGYVSNMQGLSIQRPNWVKYGPMYLKKFCYVFLGNGEFYPNFGKVVDIYQLNTAGYNSHYIIQIKKCETLFYYSHLNAYVVNVLSPSVLSVLEISSLPFFPILHAHKPFKGSETCIVLKQYVM